jgi:uncharacterized protein (TIGR02186 family)
MARRLKTCVIAAAALACVAASKPAHAQGQEEIQMGISTDLIPVTSDFSGTNVVVFGAIENPNRVAQALDRYSLAVVIRGPGEDIVVRRKERVLGVWVNRQSRIYQSVPSMYLVAASRPLPQLAPPEKLRAQGIGIANIPLTLFFAGQTSQILPAPEFAAAFRTLRTSEGLFAENDDAVDFVGSSLFRANIRVPSNIPIGMHEVTAFLFRNGELLATKSGRFEVRKHGFEDLVYRLAHDYAAFYGLFAVFLGVATGWLASVVFGGARK